MLMSVEQSVSFNVVIRNPESTVSHLSYKHDSAVLGLAKNSSSTLIASIEIGKKLAICDISTMSVEKLDIEEEPISVTFDQSSNHILVLAHNNTVIKVNADTKQTETFHLPFECRRAAWSHGNIYITDTSHNIHLTSDLTTFQLLNKIHNNEISDLKVSPNGEYLATADSNRYIYVWKTEDNSIVRDRWTYHNSRITELNWSADSKYVVTGSVDYSIILWNVESDAPVQIVKQAHKLGVNSTCFGKSDEGKVRVFSSGNDYSIKKWVITL